MDDSSALRFGYGKTLQQEPAVIARNVSDARHCSDGMRSQHQDDHERAHHALYGPPQGYSAAPGLSEPPWGHPGEEEV